MIELIVEQDKVKTVGGVWQYDIGEKLRITGIDLTGCQMQWDYDSLSQGTDNRLFEPLEGNTDLTLGGECAIPDQALTVLGEVNGYIYYTDGTPKGETLAVVRIELKERPRPTDYVSNDNIATLEMLIDNRIGGMKFIVASEDELPENPVDGAEAIVTERIGTVVSGTVERIYINDDFIPTGDHWAEFEEPQTSRVRHLVSAKIADKLVEPVEGVPAVVVPLPSLVDAVIYVKVYADIPSAFYGELKAGWNRVVFDPVTFAHIDTFSAVFGELPLLADCTIITESNTRGFLSSSPWQEKHLTRYYALNGAWHKIGSEAIEYTDLDAPYAGYPFRVIQDAFYEFGQYDTPEDISVKKGDCPLPSTVFPEGVHRSEAGFTNEETGKSITIGVYDGTEADTPFELDRPYAFLTFFDTVQTTIYINLFEQTEVDDVVLEPGCYLVADGSPTAIDKNTIPEFKNYRLVHDSWLVIEGAQPPNPLNPQFLGYYFNNAVPNVYYWDGAEYVGVGGADLSAYATKEYVDENSGVTVNEVAPINGNITLDTSNIEPTNDRRYTNDGDITRLEDTSGVNTGDQDLSAYATKEYVDEIAGAVVEVKANKVTTIDANSTDEEYPSAKAVFDFVPEIDVDELVPTMTEYATVLTLNKGNYWTTTASIEFGLPTPVAGKVNTFDLDLIVANAAHAITWSAAVEWAGAVAHVFGAGHHIVSGQYSPVSSKWVLVGSAVGVTA